MQDTVSSPTSAAPRPFSVLPPPARSLTEGRRLGVQPPQDVRHTCTLMFVAAAVLVLASVRAGWILYTGAAPGSAVQLWVLSVAAVLAAGAVAWLAGPVRRAAPTLWRWSQGGAAAALAVSVGSLYVAARLADTLMLAAGLAGALLSIVVNIALWSTSVIAWCDSEGEHRRA
ncbi:hypothetical protein [Nocardiopsis salina]|uniref:hypothetical protein n=1 Tax=Nocardiopsis salina TaxID=245836 RepID=UPI0004775901|nr:hypothetical protein [Nocardiopsis salina]